MFTSADIANNNDFEEKIASLPDSFLPLGDNYF